MLLVIQTVALSLRYIEMYLVNLWIISSVEW